MVKFSSGFKLIKPRQYDYKPLYYDREKEEQQSRRAMHDESEYKPGMIVGNMRRERYAREKSKSNDAQRRVLIRVAIIIALLALSVAILSKNNLIDGIVKLFMDI